MLPILSTASLIRVTAMGWRSGLKLGGPTNEIGKLGKLFYCRVRRFLPSGMGSEFASDVIPSDRILGSSKLHSLGLVLAARFLC
jgi:hypothetical protein